ncbi:MAG: hypothetical protein IJ642_04940 [Oscillospiraceae bacterium]|nr:hypothetical protein [Oscillospiraceae bacterium]
MKKTVRGLALFPVLVAVTCIAVGAVVGVGGTLLYMKLHSGGLGDGKDIAIQANENISPEEIPELSETVVIPETTETETESETIPETEPVTERGGYVVITVVGNEYLYGNQLYELEDLIAILHNSEELPSVKIINEKASRKAYQALTAALQNDDITIIRTDKTE